MEVMRSERIVEAEISPDTAAVALTDTFELVKLRRKAERRSCLLYTSHHCDKLPFRHGKGGSL